MSLSVNRNQFHRQMKEQTQKHSNQQVAGNPLRGRFTTEGNSTAARRAVRSFDSCCGSFGDQEMSINFDGKSIFQRILEQYGAVASNKSIKDENRDKRICVTESHFADDLTA